MRIDMRMLVVFCVSLLLSPPGVIAQKFQEPTKEELRMTSDPKAPGASAVFLNWEQRTDNAGHFVSNLARIKILTEAGKEWATVSVPFDPETAAPPIIEGRTIHADGTVIPLAGKGSDVLVLKDGGPHGKTASFTLPGVELGIILEYRWTVPLTKGKLNFIVGDPYTPLYESLMAKSVPTWDVQQRVPIRKASFYFNPFTLLESSDRDILNNQTHLTGLVDGERATNLLFTERLPAGVHVTKTPKGEYFLEVQNVPAVPQERSEPPLTSLAYRVQFYYSPYAFEDVYWDSEIKRWSKQISHLSEPTGKIKEATTQITAAADAPELKARKLYDAVQAFKNTDLEGAASDTRRQLAQSMSAQRIAQDVWAAKGGSRNDLSILYLALAKAAGLDVLGMKVADRDLHIFDPKYLSLKQLDSILVVLHLDGKAVYLDPGSKFCPFGQLDWKHSLAGGIEENSKAPTFTPPNLTKDAITAHTADLTVDLQGGITGTVKIIMSGPEALRWRQLNLTADNTEVQRQLNESLPGLLPQGTIGEISSIQGLSTSAGYVSVTVKVSGRLGTVTGKRILLPAFFFSSGAHEQFLAEEKREAPIDLRYAEQVIDDVIYHLPSGYAVESAPQAVQLPWPDRAALVIKTQPGPGVIDIKHIFARAFVLLDPKEYPALRDYYQKMAATNQQQVILLPGTAAAGN